MKKYLSFFHLHFARRLQYRTAARAGVMTQFAWGFLLIMCYQAFYRADPSAYPMAFSATVSYIWLQQAFLAMFAVWIMENDILDSVQSGSIAYELCRPLDIYDMWFYRGLAFRTSRALLRCLPVLLAAVFLPEPYGISGPPDGKTFCLFLLSMVLACMVAVAGVTLFYVLNFYTISPMGLRMVGVSVAELLTGAVIPLPFFPDKIYRIVEMLPFAAIENVPLRIYSGDIAGQKIMESIGLQVFWLVALVLAGRVLCRHAIRQIVVQGG